MTNKIEEIRQLQEKPRWVEDYIPLDKSWIIRMGVLDLFNGKKERIKTFLNDQKDLGGDLLALKGVIETWDTGGPVDVGESGTIYRIFQFASWKLKLDKEFVTQGTLTERVKKMTKDPEIIKMSLSELLDLPEKTSQWATASILFGNKERVPDPPYHLQMAFDAVDYYKTQDEQGKPWEARPDETIRKQAEVFLELMRRKDVSFTPLQSEDYCFARTFGYMTREDGEVKWQNLHGNESDRFIEMDRILKKAEAGDEVDSKDHRVVQAIAMWGLVNNRDVKFSNPDAVNKTWPKFWDFIDYAKSLKKLS